MSAKFVESAHRDQIILAADGALITAGSFCLGTGLALGLHALNLTPMDNAALSVGQSIFAVFSWLLQIGGYVIGPILVWRLKGRHFNGAALLGLLIGFPVTAAIVAVIAGITMGLDWLVSSVTGAQYLGPLLLLLVLTSSLAVVTAWLVLEAVRDLLSSSPLQVFIDVVRLLAAAGILGAAVLLSYSVVTTGDIEGVDFLLVGAVLGATVVTTADYVTRFFESKSVHASHA